MQILQEALERRTSAESCELNYVICQGLACSVKTHLRNLVDSQFDK